MRDGVRRASPRLAGISGSERLGHLAGLEVDAQAVLAHAKRDRAEPGVTLQDNDHARQARVRPFLLDD